MSLSQFVLDRSHFMRERATETLHHTRTPLPFPPASPPLLLVTLTSHHATPTSTATLTHGHALSHAKKMACRLQVDGGETNQALIMMPLCEHVDAGLGRGEGGGAVQVGMVVCCCVGGRRRVARRCLQPRGALAKRGADQKPFSVNDDDSPVSGLFFIHSRLLVSRLFPKNEKRSFGPRNPSVADPYFTHRFLDKHFSYGPIFFFHPPSYVVGCAGNEQVRQNCQKI